MEVDNEILPGELAVPHDAKGIVIFSHGSGSGRFSPRNRQVASRLHQEQIGTLLLDLLTPAEDRIITNRFDIALLAHRLVGVTQWLEQFDPCADCAMGGTCQVSRVADARLCAGCDVDGMGAAHIEESPGMAATRWRHPGARATARPAGQTHGEQESRRC